MRAWPGKSLNWQPEVDFRGLVRMMVEADTVAAKSAEPKLQFAGSGG